MNEDSIKSFLALLESLPPTPSVTFRGYVDTSITEPRAISSPILTATSHSISIATNNLEIPQIAIFIGQNGRDLSNLMMGAPSFNLEEVTYMPGSYFYQHPAQEFLGVTIQLYEEMRLTEEERASPLPVYSTPGHPFSLSLSLRSALLVASASNYPKGHQNVFSFPWGNVSTRREAALTDH